jgi:nucleoside-diphosphate-sugar epimerase
MNTSQQPIVLITGSSGLIGHAAASRFVTDYDVMGFDREGPQHPPPETEYIVNCDLSSDQSVRDALAEVRRFSQHHAGARAV